MTLLDRRTFLARGAGAMLTAAALDRLAARAALGSTGADAADGYGPIAPMRDQRGRFVLALPAGFSYVTFGEIGSRMSDGNRTPLALDGMAAFAGPDGTVRLIRNHEDRNPPGGGSVGGPAAAKYDASVGGGTTTLDYDPRRRRLVRDFISLNGTTVNCAGGFGPGRRSWLTGEETIGGPANTDPAKQFDERHGYLFEVPLDRGPNQLERGEPLRAAGRFSHEAAATDQRTGIVYETEDPGSGRGAGFYRFIPDDPGDLTAGRLQILGVAEMPTYDARQGQTVGLSLPVKWIDIPDPDPEYVNDDDPHGTFRQGRALGAALFNRLEGCWYDEADGSTYFVSTSGGDAKNGDTNSDGYDEGYGQVWEFRPRARSGGSLILHYESPGGEALDSPDNMTVTPGGGLLLAEDDASDSNGEDVNRLVGITAGGESFVFARNVFSDTELAGICFSPDGKTAFVNLYGDSTGTPATHAGKGMTCAITGPWGDGPL